MGSGVSRVYQNGARVMFDPKGTFEEFSVGVILDACAASVRNNFEYTIAVNDNTSYCLKEQCIKPLHIPELEWISDRCRDVAVWFEMYGDNSLFEARILRRSADGFFEVEFKADGYRLDGIVASHMRQPRADTIKDRSPKTMACDELWLIDRKIKQSIDVCFPFDGPEGRVSTVMSMLELPRSLRNENPITGQFTGKKQTVEGASTPRDSEGYPAHPSPLPELMITSEWINAHAKFAGKIKFANTYKIGPNYRNDNWVTLVDAGDPLYFYACLPVYAGLICLGEWNHEPEWVKANDVALVGVALYADGQLQASFTNPPVSENTKDPLCRHLATNFIPGCCSTYQVDNGQAPFWIGGVFTMAPADQDMEVTDDIYTIEAYHRILKEAPQRLRAQGKDTSNTTIEVNLILSTDYLATTRQVCSGSVTVYLTERGLGTSSQRLRDVQANKVNSRAALYPKRPLKAGAECTGLSIPTAEQALMMGPQGMQRNPSKMSSIQDSRASSKMTAFQDISRNPSKMSAIQDVRNPSKASAAQDGRKFSNARLAAIEDDPAESSPVAGMPPLPPPEDNVSAAGSGVGSGIATPQILHRASASGKVSPQVSAADPVSPVSTPGPPRAPSLSPANFPARASSSASSPGPVDPSSSPGAPAGPRPPPPDTAAPARGSALGVHPRTPSAMASFGGDAPGAETAAPSRSQGAPPSPPRLPGEV